jgi:glutathione synthase/RimK-type ligase-like ATP-grasp enzyme
VPTQCESRYKEFVRAEQQQFFDGLYSLLPTTVRFYNHPDAHRRMDRKAYQIRLAYECGFRVPDTCITSDPQVAKHFISTYPQSIYKSFWGNEEFWQPTRLVMPSVVNALDALQLSPVIFQEYIEGNRDIRVTVIDSCVTAVGFDISKSRYKWDVRIDTKIPCSQITLPLYLIDKILEFCRRSSLRYAAIDLREMPSGEYCFFEVNPAGQFLYLDLLSGTQLSKTMAEALQGNVPSGDPVLPVEDHLKDIEADAGSASEQVAPLNSIGESVTHLL